MSCFVAFPERVVHIWAAVLIAVYEEAFLWYVPQYIISSARELGMAMDVVLGSRWNVRNML